jgi:hypothetical protein
LLLPVATDQKVQLVAGLVVFEHGDEIIEILDIAVIDFNDLVPAFNPRFVRRAARRSAMDKDAGPIGFVRRRLSLDAKIGSWSTLGRLCPSQGIVPEKA